MGRPSKRDGRSERKRRKNPESAGKRRKKLGSAEAWPVSATLGRDEVFRRILAPLKPGKMLDLGSGHGRFALEAMGMGWEVTAVDARGARFPDEPGVKWVVSDIRDFAFGSGDYDLINCLGLFYHLTVEDQIALLARCSGTFTTLETHVAAVEESQQGGYGGRIYVEARPGVTDDKLRAAVQSAWGNREAFWPTENSLLRMVRDAGFTCCAPVRPYHYRDRDKRNSDRTFYLCYPR